MVIDGNQTYSREHSVVYRTATLECCTPETHIYFTTIKKKMNANKKDILLVLTIYISIFKVQKRFLLKLRKQVYLKAAGLSLEINIWICFSSLLFVLSSFQERFSAQSVRFTSCVWMEEDFSSEHRGSNLVGFAGCILNKILVWLQGFSSLLAQ